MMKSVKLFGDVYLVQSSDELFDLVLLRQEVEFTLVEGIPDPTSYHEPNSFILNETYLDLVERCLDKCSFRQVTTLLEQIKPEQIHPTKLTAFLTNQILAVVEFF